MQENCFPMYYTLETHVLQDSIWKLVVYFLAEWSSDSCAQSWLASSLMTLQQLADMFFTPTSAVNKNTTKHWKHYDLGS